MYEADYGNSYKRGKRYVRNGGNAAPGKGESITARGVTSPSSITTPFPPLTRGKESLYPAIVRCITCGVARDT